MSPRRPRLFLSLLQPWDLPSLPWPNWSPIPEAYERTRLCNPLDLSRIPLNLPPNITQFERKTIDYLKRRINYRRKMNGNAEVAGTNIRVRRGHLVVAETRDSALRGKLRTAFEWARDEEELLRREAEEEGWFYDTCGEDDEEDEEAGEKTGMSARELYALFLERTPAGIDTEDSG